MRLSENEERALAEEILAHEAAAADAVKGTAFERRLTRGRSGRERTRGKDVERLGDAVSALVTAAKHDVSLSGRARAAELAWRRCQEIHWRLAMSAIGVARSEVRRRRYASLGRPDAMQEATLGLVEAARRYDPAARASFGTYARWWVRAALGKAKDESGVVRIPASALKCQRQLQRHLADREAAGERASLGEAASAVGVDLQRASQVMALQTPRSLDEPLPGTPTLTTADILEDEALPDPDEVVEHRSRWSMMLRALDALDERSQEVVRRRYGLDEAPPATLAEIARDFGVTPQRIRQIQMRAESRIAEHTSARLAA